MKCAKRIYKVQLLGRRVTCGLKLVQEQQVDWEFIQQPALKFTILLRTNGIAKPFRVNLFCQQAILLLLTNLFSKNTRFGFVNKYFFLIDKPFPVQIFLSPPVVLLSFISRFALVLQKINCNTMGSHKKIGRVCAPEVSYQISEFVNKLPKHLLTVSVCSKKKFVNTARHYCNIT